MQGEHMPCECKIDSEELGHMNEALIDEMIRFNAALVRGAFVLFHAKAGDRQVLGVETSGWYVCSTPEGQSVKFKGANDDIWADLLRQAGVDRHPHFP
jgi:hypothetical protein